MKKIHYFIALISLSYLFLFTGGALAALSVTLSASPNSGNPPLNGVSLTATLDSSGTGVDYTFYCNRSDTGATVTTPFDAQFLSETGVAKTVPNLCSYPQPGTYLAKVVVRRGANFAQHQVTITVVDTIPPTVPAGLTAVATSSSRIDIQWSASTDYVGVAGYKIYRNGTEVATSGTTSYSDTGLTSNTTYLYKVSAYDAAGNNSAQSSQVSAKTFTVIDGICGTSNGRGFVSPPSSNLCIDGTVSSLTDTGTGWTWTCAGSNGGATDNCSATKTTAQVVDGTCGTANGGSFTIAPSTGLCSKGSSGIVATSTTGWTWTCAGYNGGATDNCSATKIISPPSLTASLVVDPPIGVAPFSGVSLKATAMGHATGLINFTYYCNRSDLGTNITADYSTKLDAQLSTSKTVYCNYQDPGTYTAKVIIERDGLLSEARQTVTVLVSAANDTVAPQVPTNFIVKALSATRVSLSWSPSVDNGEMAGYKVYRNGSLLATTKTTSYVNSYLTALTTYSYSVAGYDKAGNLSLQTAPISIVTPQYSLSVSVIPLPNYGIGSLFNVSLMASVSGTAPGPINYTFYCNRNDTGVNITTPYLEKVDGRTETKYTSLNKCSYTAAGRYYVKVIVERGGFVAEKKSIVNVKDNTPPSVPGAATIWKTNSATKILLTWPVSTDDVKVAGYYIYRNGRLFGKNSDPFFLTVVDPTLQPPVDYIFTIVAFDATGNRSSQGPQVSTAAIITDTVVPSVPTGLTTTVLSPAKVKISWTASTDNSRVAGYKIYRDGVKVAAVGAAYLSFSDSRVSPQGAYSYTMESYDYAGNTSAQNSAVMAYTPPDITAPSIPTGLAAKGYKSYVALTWKASTDNVKVYQYKIYRDGAEVGSTVNLKYSDNGLSANTTYSYTVAATDAAGNISSRTAAVTAFVDGSAPTVPTGLRATADPLLKIVLSWNASTDNVKVAAYRIYRNDVMVGTSSGLTYSNIKGLLPNTSYTYTVAAVDGVGNLSGKSTPVVISTLP
jgi:chitodextrinase